MNRVQFSTNVSSREVQRWFAGSSTRNPVGSRGAWVRFLLAGLCLMLLGASANAQTVIATVSAGISPSAVAVNPVTNYSYVVNAGSGTVTAVNGLTAARPRLLSVGALLPLR